jgi:hypothetical protein
MREGYIYALALLGIIFLSSRLSRLSRLRLGFIGITDLSVFVFEVGYFRSEVGYLRREARGARR